MVYSEYVNVFKQTPRNLTGYVVRTTANNTNYVYHDASNNLISATVERTAPTGKFFGYTVGQKMIVELLTKEIDSSSNRMRLIMKDINDGHNIYSSYFFLDTVEYNEAGDKATLIGYDLISGSNKYTLSDVNIVYPITLSNFARAVVTFLGGQFVGDFTGVDPILTTANFSGSESLHTVLAAIAEATGTICYCSSENKIVFRTLSTEVNDSFGPEFYFNFKTKDSVTLTKIVSATELGDNYGSGQDGYTQVLRENPFLVLREDLPTLLDAIAAKVLGLTIYPYSLHSRGNPCYEPGDCLAVTTLDGVVKPIYLVNETLVFNGGMRSNSELELGAQENPDSTPSTFGEALKGTYAKVDKVSNQIELVAGEVSQLSLTTDNISASVKKVVDDTNNLIETTNENIDSITKKVQTSMTAENASILIQQELANGVNTITTTTGYVFDNEGLTISKSGSEMTTQITEDGMVVYKDNDAVLTANNIGVDAVNLHATTYLIIGSTSRLEDWNGRTACFWI